MKEPWEPAVPIAHEESDTVYIDRHGVRRALSNRIYDEEDTDRIRQGYCCIQCGEAQYPDPPFPEHCFCCRFEMAAKQALEFARNFRGTVHIGSRVDPDEELEYAAQVVESERRHREGTAPFQAVIPNLWLPGDPR